MQETNTERTAEAKVPTTVGGYLRSLGPGLVLALMWLGVGDLISASVSGANYGYALMWGLAIALVARYFFTSAIAKYFLCNNQGDTSVLKGFGRLWKGFPLLVGVPSFILGFTYQTYFIQGAGTALHNMSGQVAGQTWGVFFWAVVAVLVATFLMTRPGQYWIIETIARISAVVLVVGFLIALFNTGVDIGGILSGLTFRLPPDVGVFSAIVVVVALIGAVGGSASNLLYTYFMEDKGWRGPRYRKLQVFDLLTGVVAIIFINVAVWSVAAESMQGTGLLVESPNDLATMMEIAMGGFGPIILWIALFCVTFTTFPAHSYAYCKLLFDSVHQTFPARGARYEKPENDPLFRWVQIPSLLILPLIFSLPFAPNLVVITIFANAFAVLVAPIIIIGIIFLTSSRRFMLPEYVNNWWQIAILVVIGVIGLWATYNVLVNLVM